MARTIEHPALKQALAALLDGGFIPPVAAMLNRTIRDVGPALRAAVLAEVPAFSSSGNPEVLGHLERHIAEHLAEISRLLGSGGIGDFEFVGVHARHRAEQRFPLEATLHAYRCGHKILSRWIRDAAASMAPAIVERAATAIADFAIEYTNTISTILTAEYVAHTRLIAEAEGDSRSELLNMLVSGFDESDGRIARQLKRAGYYQQRQSYCVALAQSTDPQQMENAARAQRIAEAVAKAVAALRIRTLMGIRNNVVTAVFSDTRRMSGWTAPQSKLAGRVAPALLVLGPAVLIGVSNDQPSTGFIPKAYREASVALDLASVTERVVQFAELPIRRLVLHRAGEQLQSALPPWTAELFDADAKAHGSLVDTLHAYANADMNVLKAARSLKVHPNTVYTRLLRINSLTGLRSQRYHDLTEMLLAAECRRI